MKNNRTRKSVFPRWAGTTLASINLVVLSLTFSASVSAQKRDKSSPPPSRPSRTQESAPAHTNSAPAQAAPRQQQSAPPQRTYPTSPRQGANSPPVTHTNPAPPAAQPSNNNNRNPGGGRVYDGNRNTNSNTNTNAAPRDNATPRDNDRRGGTTVYSPNNRESNRNPSGNTNPSLQNNTRPSGGFGNNNSGNTSNPVRNNDRPAGTYNNNRPSGGYNTGNTNRTAFPPKATIYHAPGGGQIQTRSDGSIREVRTSGGAVIHHAPDGYRRVEVSRPGGRVVVASSHGGYGYVQRPLVVSNRTYIQRTYVSHGVSYARVYRPWVYGGFTYHVYTPAHYWSPGFYSYAYNPWARPVYYGWGWNSRPWYGYYGGWFTPYPYYSSPALWLTDFLIARTLEDAYDARMEARANANANAQANYYAQTPLTPEVKQAVADEVRRQLDRERAEQQAGDSYNANGAPPLFSGGTQVFVVANSIDVDAGGGQFCAVTEGDVLQLNSAPPSNSNYAQVQVLASKGNDCRKGSTVSIALADLQEMQNQMRATIDQGLNDLQSKQGQNGLPALPNNATGRPTQAAFASQLQPDSNAATELSQVAREADREDQDVLSKGAPTVTLGQSVNEVESIFGKPTSVADLGSKKIYVYGNLKVTFTDGRVTDVQ